MNLNKKIHLSSFLILFLFVSCSTLRLENIEYNESKVLFDYKLHLDYSMVLRNDSLQIVDSTNVFDFYNELEERKNHYNADKRNENAELISPTEYRMAKEYAAISEAINHKEYINAIEKSDKLIKTFPNLKKYSDLYFLKGFAAEQHGNYTIASDSYKQFLKWSSQKYSQSFRGYAHANLTDSIFPSERIYASRWLSGKECTFDTTLFTPIIPQYYFQSFQPGYRLNKDNINPKTKDYLYLLLTNDPIGNLALGAYYYKPISHELDIVGGFESSGRSAAFSIAAPVQLYKAASNKVALKFSPFVHAYWIDSLVINDNGYSMNKWLFNAGAKLSGSYLLVPNLSLGAYYRFNIANSKNPVYYPDKNVSIWFTNEYDISFYLNIINEISLKAGMKNNDLVVGFFLSGWELSVNLSDFGFIMRMDLY